MVVVVDVIHGDHVEPWHSKVNSKPFPFTLSLEWKHTQAWDPQEDEKYGGVDFPQ